MDNDFSVFALDSVTLANLDSLGYQQMTPIQQASLGDLLAGHDLIGQAKTGSGKTVAFGLGLLNRLDRQRFCVQGLVLCPTRELADQVAKELRRLARGHANTKILTLCGGVPLGPQVGSLEHGAHVVVGTPGRILKHLGKKTLDLSQVQVVTLDEADRMLDMGFYDDIAAILAATPKQRQTLLFSATYPDGIRDLSAAFQRTPKRVTIKQEHAELAITQRFHEVREQTRLESMVAVLAEHRPVSSVVFCNTREACQAVADTLVQRGVSVLSLHGDLDQKQRDQALVRFSNRSVSVLVATDVAARGIDIKDLELVVNYELPRDPEVYVHRVGRTGRAGSKGLAVSLFKTAEVGRMLAIEDYIGVPAEQHPVPTVVAGQRLDTLAPMVTLCIDGGRKQKVRPGDLLGALTAGNAIAGSSVGSIDIFDYSAFVAIERAVHKQALRVLNEGGIKGRQFKVRLIN